MAKKHPRKPPPRRPRRKGRADQGQAAPAHPHRPRRRRGARHLGRPRRAPRRHLRALSQDQELPLAHVGPALPRLPPAARRAVRPDLRHDRPDGRARPQARRHDAALDRRDRPQAAHRRQRRRLRRPAGHAGRARQDNQQCVAAMRSLHATCDEHGDVATASLLEVWIDEGERRAWFLFEATRTSPNTTY